MTERIEVETGSGGPVGDGAHRGADEPGERAPDGRCVHCGLPSESRFCCAGCAAAYTFLRGHGLERFYDLRGADGTPVSTAECKLDPAFEQLIARAKEGGTVHLDIQGMHCAGCVWLIERLFERQVLERRDPEGSNGAGRIDLDPAGGTATLLVPEGFDLAAFQEEVGAVGYRLGPPGEKAQSNSDDLLWRIAVCVALAGNAMFYSIAVYLGLEDSPLRSFLDRLAFGAGALSVLVGGSVFIRSAYQALIRGVVSMDLPIALGIVLAFLGATGRFLLSGGVDYVDTIAVFVALMLIGRWLQERALLRNRRRLLADRSADALMTRRLDTEGARLVPCAELEEGDTLLLGKGDLVATDVRCLGQARFSLDWINGESEARTFEAGAIVPAGAFSDNEGLVQVTVAAPFAESMVPRLLRETRKVDDDAIGWWKRIGTGYTLFVLAAATGGAAVWLWRGDPEAALQVATAVLVVTCPCAFGIALPLAREAAHARLRRAGLYVRTSSFLERLHEIRRIVFDKTGTLTTGEIVLRDRHPIDVLSPLHRTRLASLAAVSLHPRSKAIAAVLPSVEPERSAREITGKGIEAVIEGRRYRLGLAEWAAVGSEGDVVFSEDGIALCALEMDEALRRDAAEEIAGLQQQFELTILSGDRPEKVAAMAKSLHIDEALGGQSPDDKAAYVEAHDPRHTLMVGDGLNDHLALLSARCAGTPAVDRPFVASRCDFYLTSGGLAPIRAAFEAALWLRRTQRVLLAVALSYNAIAIAIAWSGAMAPWLAAVLMPSSSLLTLALVALRARQPGRSFRSTPALVTT